MLARWLLFLTPTKRTRCKCFSLLWMFFSRIYITFSFPTFSRQHCQHSSCYLSLKKTHQDVTRSNCQREYCFWSFDELLSLNCNLTVTWERRPKQKLEKQNRKKEVQRLLQFRTKNVIPSFVIFISQQRNGGWKGQNKKEDFDFAKNRTIAESCGCIFSSLIGATFHTWPVRELGRTISLKPRPYKKR